MQLDPYLALSKEAYDDLIRAAGLKAGAVAKVCNEQGIWGSEAIAEDPVLESVAEEEVVDDEPPQEEPAATGTESDTDVPSADDLME